MYIIERERGSHNADMTITQENQTNPSNLYNKHILVLSLVVKGYMAPVCNLLNLFVLFYFNTLYVKLNQQMVFVCFSKKSTSCMGQIFNITRKQGRVFKKGFG